MKKNIKRLRSIDNTQLAQVTGGASAQEVAMRTKWVSLSTDHPLDSAISVFFFAAASA